MSKDFPSCRRPFVTITKVEAVGRAEPALIFYGLKHVLDVDDARHVVKMSTHGRWRDGKGVVCNFRAHFP